MLLKLTKGLPTLKAKPQLLFYALFLFCEDLMDLNICLAK